MTPLELDTISPRVTDAGVQKKIAEALQIYHHIDLTIPAQRDVANQVRDGLKLAPLSPIGDVAVNQELTGGAKEI